MFLTRLEIDTKKRETMRALAAPQRFHGAIVKSIPIETRYLWRIDRLGEKTYLLLSSPDKPNLTDAAAQFGIDGQSWQTISYDPLLERISNGDKWHFRLRANPVISKSHGKVLAHVTVEQQEKWLYDRAAAHGFSLEYDKFSVVASEWLSFCKGTEGGRRVTLHAVTFEGLLTITDAELFREALTQGIGRGKAYGLGMMTIAGKE